YITLGEQDNQTIPSADTTYFVCLDYNDGTPQIVLDTTNPYNRTTSPDRTQIPIGKVRKDGDDNVHYISGGFNLQDGVAKLHSRAGTLRSKELASGSAIAYSGTNNFTMTEGIAYVGINRIILSSYDSAVTKFTPVYRDGAGGWTYGADRNTIDYNHYDKGDGTLGNIGVSRYSVHWVYKHIDDDHVYVRYGEGNYKLAEAETVGEPTKPDHLTDFGCLIGKIIAPHSGGSFAGIQMVTDTFFVGTSVSDHGELGGLDDDDHPQYWKVKINNSEVNGGYLEDQITGSGGILISTVDEGDGKYHLNIDGNNVWNDEKTQDAIGNILTDTNTIDFTYDDNTPSIIADLNYQDSDSIDLSDDASGLKAEIKDTYLNTHGDGRWLKLDCGNDPIWETLEHEGSHWLRYKDDKDYNEDIVTWSAYPGILTTGGTDFGMPIVLQLREWFFYAHDYRLRQTGETTKLDIYLNTVTGLEEFKVSSWRENADGTFTRIDTTDNLAGSLSAGNNENVSISLEVRTGDYYSVFIKNNGTAQNYFKGRTVTTGDTYYIDGPMTGNNVDWLNDADGTESNVIAPVVLKGTAPEIVVVGDSIMDGYSSDTNYRNHSFIDNRNYTNLENNPAHFIERTLNGSVQNYAVGGSKIHSSTANCNSIIDRWTEIVALKPKTVILQGGVNDILASENKQNVLNDYETMLNSAATNDIFVIVVSIAPADGSTNEQAATIDDWNGDIKALCDNYSNAVYVDIKDRMGAFRVGGDAGNLWDLKDGYCDTDTLHLTPLGTKVYSDFILEHMGAVVSQGITKTANFSTKTGFTVSESGRLAEEAIGEKISHFGKGAGGVSYLGDNVYLDPDGNPIARTSAGAGAGKASILTLGDGKILHTIAEETTDGEKITDLIYTLQDDINRTWIRKLAVSSSIGYSPDENFRSFIKTTAENLSVDFRGTGANGSGNDACTIDYITTPNEYWNYKNMTFRLKIVGAEITNTSGSGMLATMFTPDTTGLNLGDWVTITGTTTYNGTYQIVGIDPNVSFSITHSGTATNETGEWVRVVSSLDDTQFLNYSSNGGSTYYSTGNKIDVVAGQELLWNIKATLADDDSYAHDDYWDIICEVDNYLYLEDHEGNEILSIDRWGRMRMRAFDATAIRIGTDDTSECLSIAHGDNGLGDSLSMIMDNAEWDGKYNKFMARGSEPCGLMMNNGVLSYYADSGKTAGTEWSSKTERWKTSPNGIFEMLTNKIKTFSNADTAAINIKTGTAGTPSEAVEGDVWYDDIKDAIAMKISDVNQYYIGHLKSNTSTTQAVNTTSETVLFTYSLPADFFTSEKTLKLTGYGLVSTKSSPAGTLTLRIKYGSGTIGIPLIPPLGAIPMLPDLDDLGWSIDVLITCRTAGTTGTVMVRGWIRTGVNVYDTYHVSIVSSVTNPENTATINTTTANNLTLTAQWETAHASNNLRLLTGVLEALN
ncbi:MAG: hypothetical protein DRP74_07290, partial [Candidatus Omnitrophota bacterium]